MFSPYHYSFRVFRLPGRISNYREKTGGKIILKHIKRIGHLQEIGIFFLAPQFQLT